MKPGAGTTESKSGAVESGAVVGKPAYTQACQPAKDSIKHKNQWPRDEMAKRPVGNSEFGDEPEAVGRKGWAERDCQRRYFFRSEAIEEKVGYYEVVRRDRSSILGGV